MSPFVVFSLPRSRSAWLSVFLSAPNRTIGHDIGIESDNIEGFNATLNKLGGTCETGAAFAFHVLRQALPESPFVVIRRDLYRVVERLKELGFGNVREEIERRDAALDAIASTPGTLEITYDDLNYKSKCDMLYRFCLGVPTPEDWWEKLSGVRIEIDMPTRVSRLIHRGPYITKLKSEVALRGGSQCLV